MFDATTDKRLVPDQELRRNKFPVRVRVSTLDFHSSDDGNAGVQTQALFGEVLDVYLPKEKMAVHEDWLLVQRRLDGYLGFVQKFAIEMNLESDEVPSHRVIVPRTFLYREAELKSSNPMPLSLGSEIFISSWQEVRGTKYGLLKDGRAVIANHIRALDAHFCDYVSIAESLIDVPYLWGGNSAFGIDCSGLVQLALQLCGKGVLRDSDMQAASCGKQITGDIDEIRLQRGDLIFWQGHVGIMQNSKMLLHANGNTMSVALEPLDEAVQRIQYLYGKPTMIRRF